MSFRVLVCGSRHWTDEALIWEVLALRQPDVVIHGAARGADSMAGRWARKHGVEELPFPARWDRDGKGAGPKRNRRMLVEGQPDLVLAFADDLAKSRGTANMVSQSQRHGVPLILYNYAGIGVHR